MVSLPARGSTHGLLSPILLPVAAARGLGLGPGGDGGFWAVWRLLGFGLSGGDSGFLCSVFAEPSNVLGWKGP